MGTNDIEIAASLRFAVEITAVKIVLANETRLKALRGRFEECIREMRRAPAVDDNLAFWRANLRHHGAVVASAEVDTLMSIWTIFSKSAFVYIMRNNKMLDYQSVIEEHEILTARFAADEFRKLRKILRAQLGIKYAPDVLSEDSPFNEDG